MLRMTNIHFLLDDDILIEIFDLPTGDVGATSNQQQEPSDSKK